MHFTFFKMSDALKFLLSRKLFLGQLVVYLKSTCSEENALCYNAILRFKTRFDDSDAVSVLHVARPMVLDAKLIYDVYFAQNAVLKVNVTSHASEPLVALFEQV